MEQFRNFLRVLVLLLVSMVVTVSQGYAHAQTNDGDASVEDSTTAEVVPDQYIVVFKEESFTDGLTTSGLTVEQLANQFATEVKGEILFVYEYALKGFAIKMSSRGVELLQTHDEVDHISPDQRWQLDPIELNSIEAVGSWGLDRIDQRNLPLNNTYNYSNAGIGVRVYIIDTGIRATHVDFGGRVVGGFTAINDGNGTNDCYGHGTHVAGTVGGTTYGVTKSVVLVPVRVLNCSGSGTTSGVIAGINWVIGDTPGDSVANMSLYGSADTNLDTAVNNLINAGVTTVVAAGNSNQNACNYSPARVGAAITVGATTSNDSRWLDTNTSGSNYGNCLDIFAPGKSITSAWYSSDTATAIATGTSMAAPHVAGAAALFLHNNPGATPSTVRNTLVNNATNGVVANPGTGSPNRLLFTLYMPTYSCFGTAATLVGTDSANTLNGTAGNDAIVALGGNDTVNGNGGNDIICGGAGQDTLYGNTGSDTIYGGPDNDTIRGGQDNDTIHGNNGVDLMYGDLGTDYVYGNQGNDTLYGGNGTSSSDLNDFLYGGKGNDTLYGEAGNDALDGNLNTDVCTGGTGTDTFANCETVYQSSEG